MSVKVINELLNCQTIATNIHWKLKHIIIGSDIRDETLTSHTNLLLFDVLF